MGMDDEPLANIEDHCKNCKYIMRYKNNQITLGFIRRKCSYCRLGRQGIYKADAIITALEAKQGIKNPYRGGRRSKIPEGVRRTIVEHYKAKLSIREIERLTGYNKGTVGKIIKEWKSQNSSADENKKD